MDKPTRTNPPVNGNEPHRPETGRNAADIFGLQNELSFRLKNMLPAAEGGNELLSPPYFTLFNNLEELLGSMIHDGRNRLGPVKGYASLIETKAEPGSQIDQWTKRIIGNVEAMEQHLELLSIYRMKGSSILEEVSPATVIEEAIQTLQLIFKKEISIEVINQVPDRHLFHIQILKRMIIHVLRNALESGSGDGPITVTVSYDKPAEGESQAGTAILITVADKGRGITDSRKQSIWKPFFSTKPSHFGLGLTYVSMAASLMGARVDLDSREGFGTTVSINIQAKGGTVETA